jgi:hypothetical protein
MRARRRRRRRGGVWQRREAEGSAARAARAAVAAVKRAAAQRRHPVGTAAWPRLRALRRVYPRRRYESSPGHTEQARSRQQSEARRRLRHGGAAFDMQPQRRPPALPPIRASTLTLGGSGRPGVTTPPLPPEPPPALLPAPPPGAAPDTRLSGGEPSTMITKSAVARSPAPSVAASDHRYRPSCTV